MTGEARTPDSPAEKLRVALELFEEGVEIERRNLRRRHPDAAEEEIEGHLVAWLHHRPGADLGDGPEASEEEPP